MASAGLAMLAAAWAGYYWLLSNMSCEYNANQCLNKIKRQIDFNVLRAWAAKAISESATNPMVEDHSYRELGHIWSKAPPWVTVVEKNGIETYVQVSWGGGGGIGHWGLWVGSQHFVMTSNFVDTNLCTFSLLDNGVYFWRDPH
jgi:hypothetical protein